MNETTDKNDQGDNDAEESGNVLVDPNEDKEDKPMPKRGKGKPNSKPGEDAEPPKKKPKKKDGDVSKEKILAKIAVLTSGDGGECNANGEGDDDSCSG